jgi:hypothetical protein
MRSGSYVAVLLFCCAPTMAMAGSRGVIAVVRSLGVDTTNEDYDILEQHRCDAPALLVGQLAPVQQRVIPIAAQTSSRRAMHVVEVLAALRFLTGRDFFGPLGRVHDKNSRQFLTAGLPPGQSRFDAIWMSRQTTYFAPVETQRAIIRRWRAFVAAAWDCGKPANPRRKDDFFFRYGSVIRYAP